VKVKKNKVAPPFREAEFDILFGKGISRSNELVDMGVEAEIVEKSGSWYSYNEQRIGQGKDNARRYLEENPEIMEEIDVRVREHFGITAKVESAPPKETAKAEE
jgi:recombination protein RecA